MFAPVWDLFVRLRKPLLNDDYAARRSICAFSAVEGMWAVRANRVVLRWLLTIATPSVDFATPRSLCCLGGGGLQTTRPNFRVACSSNTAQTPTMLWRGFISITFADAPKARAMSATWVLSEVCRHGQPAGCADEYDEGDDAFDALFDGGSGYGWDSSSGGGAFF